MYSGNLPSGKLYFWETDLLGKILWEITSGKHPNICMVKHTVVR